MTLQRQIRFWVFTAIAFGVFLYLFSSVLLPFVAGMALAYLLDPLADRLERRGLSRTMATLTIVVMFVIVLVIAFVLLVPVLVSQASSFIERLPVYLKSLQSFITNIDEARVARALGMSTAELQAKLGNLVGEAAKWLGTVVQGLLSGGQAILSVLSLFVITPVVAFYLLHDWDYMIAKVDSWLPLPYREVIRRLASEMDDVVSAFVRGQIMVGMILGTFYAIALTVIGLNFGLLIGVSAGMLGFIPYVGSGLGLITAVAIAVAQFGAEWHWIVATAAVFGVGQVIEGYVLQPKLIGESVGLHPVWLMFALFAFGALFGFVGLLIAIPAAACVGVLFRFALGQYLASPLYRGYGVAAADVQAGADEA